MTDCVFCKIVKKELQAEIVYEDDRVIAFKDIHPKAPFHILIVPKKHIESVDSLEAQDRELTGDLFLVGKKIAEENNLQGYKLVINVGRNAGQLVDHLHIHLLSGKTTELP